jgi:endo-1,4-beta-D-glucanase Y
MLLAATWRQGDSGASPRVASHSSLEGDQQVALSLLFAYKLWGDPAYEQAALALLNDIWEHDTIDIGGRRIAVADDASGATPGQVTVPVSALSPATYRIFGDADPAHPWGKLVDSTYDLLAKIRGSSDHGGDVGLAPDVVQLDRKSGKLVPAASDAVTTEGGKLLWNLTIDYLWFQDKRAKEAIGGLHFYRDQLTAENGQLFESYDLNGKPTSGKESPVVTAGVIPSLLITDAANLDTANAMFAKKILHGLTDSAGGAHWGSNDADYAVQTSFWMTSALMDGAVTNLWNGDELMNWGDVLPQLRR